MTPRHKRFAMIGLGVAAVGVAAALVLNAFQSNLVFFFTPTQVAKGEAPKGKSFRIGGLVEAGYDRQVVRKSAVVGENMLPRANRVASLLQRWLLGTHQGAVGRSHLDYYLDEFVFRFNRRRSRSRGLLFYRLVEQALAIAPVRCPQLVGGSQPQGIVQGEHC